MRMARRLAAIAAVALAGGGAPPALAGDVPTSAYAQSLRVEPELLDSVALVFAFPQRAGGTRSELLALAATEIDGVGALFRVGAGRLFVLSQDAILASEEPKDFDLLGSYQVGQSLFQVGYGRTFGSLRWGAAVRAGHDSRRDRDTYYPTPESSARIDETVGTTRVWQSVLGLGATSSRGWSTDVYAEFSRLDVDADVRSIDSDRTEELHVHTVDRIQVNAGTYTVIPLGARSSLTVGGRYRETSRQTKVRSVLDDVESRDGLFDYSHEWSVGLLVMHNSEQWGRIRGFGHYRNFRGPLEPSVSTFEIGSTRRVDADVVTFGVSMERSMGAEITALVGLSNAFSIEESVESRPRFDESQRYVRRVREVLSQSFALGLTRSYRRIHATGSVRTNLSIGDPFLALDLGFDLD